MNENSNDTDQGMDATAEIPVQPTVEPATTSSAAATSEPAATGAAPRAASSAPAVVTIPKRTLGLIVGVLVAFVLLGGVFAAGASVGEHLGGRPGSAGLSGPGGPVAQPPGGPGMMDGQRGGEFDDEEDCGDGMRRGQQAPRQAPGQGVPGQGQPGSQGTPPGAPNAAPLTDGAQ